MQSPVGHLKNLHGVSIPAAVNSALWQRLASSSEQIVSEGDLNFGVRRRSWRRAVATSFTVRHSATLESARTAPGCWKQLANH